MTETTPTAREMGILWNTTRQRHARYVVLNNNSKYPSRFWGVRTFHRIRECAIAAAKSAINYAQITSPPSWYVVVDTQKDEVITGE